MKKLIGVIVVVLVLAAGFVGAAYWSGQQAERWYKDALAEGSKHPNVKMNVVRYERGLFSSKATTRFQLVLGEGGDANMPDLSFSTREDIYHGPLPLAGWGVPGVPMALTGAVVRQTLDPESSAWTRELAKLYGSQEPLVAIAQVGFDGASNTRITMPPLTLNNVEDLQSFNFAGLQGQFQVAPRGTAVQGGMTVASLEAVGKSGGEGQPAAGPKVNLRDLAVTLNQRKGAFDLMFGDSSFKVGELRVQDPSSGAPVVFADLGMNATAALHPQNPQQVNVEALFKAGKITVDPWSGTGSMKLAFHNLDGATVGQLQQWQQKMAVKPDDPQALEELLKLVKTLLRGKPEFVLDTQAKLAQGDWQGKLTLNFQDYGDIDPAQNPAGLLSALQKGLAEISVSKTLAETVLVGIAKEQFQAQAEEGSEQAGEQAMQDMAAQQVAQQIQSMMAAGFVRLDGDRYESTARFEGGKLFVNDKEIPLGSMVGADAGMTDEMPLEPDGGAGEETPQR
ncbi:MAG TPA: YdgA family protein [Candidatus Competibacter sp.]|nr:YdgA family protein [Candidatus Competibacter sp.]